MKRTGVLGSVLALVLALGAFCAWPVGAQDNKESPRSSPEAPPALPVPPVPGSSAADISQGPTPAITKPPAPPPTLREQLKAETIDTLLDKLQALKAQQAELERVEKETVTVLKEKLKEQKQQLQKLGVLVEESSPSPPPRPKPLPPLPTPDDKK